MQVAPLPHSWRSRRPRACAARRWRPHIGRMARGHRFPLRSARLRAGSAPARSCPPAGASVARSAAARTGQRPATRRERASRPGPTCRSRACAAARRVDCGGAPPLCPPAQTLARRVWFFSGLLPQLGGGCARHRFQGSEPKRADWPPTRDRTGRSEYLRGNRDAAGSDDIAPKKKPADPAGSISTLPEATEADIGVRGAQRQRTRTSRAAGSPGLRSSAPTAGKPERGPDGDTLIRGRHLRFDRRHAPRASGQR
jgi:hypothetical protein